MRHRLHLHDDLRDRLAECEVPEETLTKITMPPPTREEVNALIERLKDTTCSGSLWVLMPEMVSKLRALQAENDRLKEDGALLDALEASIKREPLLLHNCKDSSEWPRWPLGLGLCPWQPRTLRQALRDCVLPPPESAADRQRREDEEYASGASEKWRTSPETVYSLVLAALAHARKEATP